MLIEDAQAELRRGFAGGGVGALWKSLVAHGMEPLAAVDHVLPHADGHGRRSLRIVIQYRRSLDAPARSALLARLG